MAQIEGEIVIQRSIGTVFDFVADERNEPQYNAEMKVAEKISDGDIGTGTQFRAEMMSGGRLLPMIIEFTTFERPLRLGSRSAMAGMVILGELTFEPVGDSATRMRWAWTMKPTGALRLLSPVMVLIGRRQERQIWTSLKRCLEARSS